MTDQKHLVQAYPKYPTWDRLALRKHPSLFSKRGGLIQTKDTFPLNESRQGDSSVGHQMSDSGLPGRMVGHKSGTLILSSYDILEKPFSHLTPLGNARFLFYARFGHSDATGML